MKKLPGCGVYGVGINITSGRSDLHNKYTTF